jgi:hypothetical protein
LSLIDDAQGTDSRGAQSPGGAKRLRCDASCACRRRPGPTGHGRRCPREQTSRGQDLRRRGEDSSLGGKTPEGQNPMGVSGAKQTREALGGVNRRGGAKPRGRNGAGEANPHIVDSRCSWRRRGRNPREGAGAERPSGRLRGSYPGGEQNPMRGWSCGRKLHGGGSRRKTSGPSEPS